MTHAAAAQGHEDKITAASKHSGSQAMLVFLPGAGEIERLARQLRTSSQLRQAAAGTSFLILPLHGSLPPGQQVLDSLNFNLPTYF